MRKRGCKQFFFLHDQLQLVLLISVAAFVGYALCHLYFTYLVGPAESGPHSSHHLQTSPPVLPSLRWRLYGVAFIDDAFSVREKRELGRRRDETVKLFSSASGDTHVQELVEGLHNLQVACHERPQSERQALGEKYAKFLEVLSIYTVFHKRERQREGARRLVWVCDAHRACGGLADRVKGVAYALILSILSRRVLLLDWRDRKFGEQEYLQPNIIDWRLTTEEKKRAYPEEDYESYYDLVELAGQGNLSKEAQAPADSVLFLHIFSILGGIGVDSSAEDLQNNLEAIYGSWNWILLESNMEPSSLVNGTKTASLEWIAQGMAGLGLDKLPPHDIDNIVGLVFRYLFRFSAEILQEAAAAREVLGLNNAAYVGVHVRTGFAGSVQRESIEHPKLYRTAQQWGKTLSCASNHATETLGPTALLFLATDSNLVKSKSHRYGGRYRCLDNTVVHLDRLERTPHEAGDVEREGVLSVWVELILLAESHSIVMGESGFSFLAHSLCFIPEANTINGLTCNPF